MDSKFEFLEPQWYPSSMHLIGKLPIDVVNELKYMSNEVRLNPLHQKHNLSLAGNIEEEYTLMKDADSLLLPFVSEMANKLEDIHGGGNFARANLKEVGWKHESVWVNFQKKYEFNPIHNHSGYYSYVTWLQIPYDIEDELNMPHVKDSHIKSASKFSLIYNDANGGIRCCDIPLTKGDEGLICMFGSRMHHQVYPFYTSDDYRISISGNLVPKNCTAVF